MYSNQCQPDYCECVNVNSLYYRQLYTFLYLLSWKSTIITENHRTNVQDQLLRSKNVEAVSNADI